MAALNHKTLTLTRVHNPFNRLERDQLSYEYRGEPLSAIRAGFPADVDFVVSLNGRIVPEQHLPLVTPQPGDHLVFVPVPAGGNTGKQIGRIVGMIAIAILSIYTGGAAAALYGPMAGMMAGAAVSLVGGILVGAVFAPKAPSQETGSNAYSWSPVTLQRQGIPMPRYYGTCKITGNIISGYIDSDGTSQTVNALISLGMGPLALSTAETVTLNGQPYSNFRQIPTPVLRRGDLDQPAVPNFESIKTEHYQSVAVREEAPYTYLTPGDDFDALTVEISIPGGTGIPAGDGSFMVGGVRIRVEVKRAEDSEWRVLTHTIVTLAQNAGEGYWSFGWWADDGTRGLGWVEFSRGSSVESDHYEGEPEYPGSFYIWHWVPPTGAVAATYDDFVTISGGSPSPVKFMYSAGELPKGRYSVRVTRLPFDAAGGYQLYDPLKSDLYLTNVREITYQALTYPRQALVGLKALTTDQLSGSFQFAITADCALVRVCDGAGWSVKWSNNPAWVLWDVMTQPVFDNALNVLRYDGVDPSRLDLPKWRELADWCDAQVPDGKGGTEKRITFNGGFDAEQTLWDAAQAVCQIAGCSLVPTGTGYTLAIEKPVDAPVGLFGVGNIGIDSFKETFLSMEDRAAAIEVDFLDREQGYERTQISIVNGDIPTIANKVAVQAMGVTSASEAARLAQRQLRVNQLITRTIQFSADVDAIACTVGDVINIQHDVPQWGYGGRLVAATSTTLQLDQEVTLEAGKAYSVLLRLSDDSTVSRAVANAPGTTDTLTVSTPFGEVPAVYDVYAFGESAKVTKPFRVISLSPNGDLEATITAVEYNESVYDDSGAPALPTPNYSSLPDHVEVTGLTLTETASVDESGVIRRSIVATWFTGDRAIADHFDLYYRALGTPWQFAGQTRGLNFAISGVAPVTTYQVAVLGFDAAGGHVPFDSAPSEEITTGSTSAARGENLRTGVTGLQIFGQGNDTQFLGRDCRLIWNKVCAVDQDVPAGAESNGAGSSVPDLWFKDYEVKILDTDGNLRRTEYLTIEQYSYAFEKNYADGNGVPVRTFTVEVRARDRYFRVSEVPARLTVSNPAPAMLT